MPIVDSRALCMAKIIKIVFILCDPMTKIITKNRSVNLRKVAGVYLCCVIVSQVFANIQCIRLVQ